MIVTNNVTLMKPYMSNFPFADFYSNYSILKIKVIIVYAIHRYHLTLSIDGFYKIVHSFDFNSIIHKRYAKFAKYLANVSCYFKGRSLLVVVLTSHIVIMYSTNSEKIMMAFNMMRIITKVKAFRVRGCSLEIILP